jgi:hypothetical protein
MRLVINSHKNYTAPLAFAVKTLMNDHFDLSDLIVIIGGCDNNTEPSLHSLGYTIVQTTLNNFDYTGLSVLHKLKEHPNIKSPSFFYTLDTVRFLPGFKVRFQEISRLFEINDLSDALIACPRPNSNVVAFGHKVLSSYGNEFDLPISKRDAIVAEVEGRAEQFRGLEYFAKCYQISPRVLIGQEDVYETGIPRNAYHYPDFHLVKYILEGWNGDFSREGLKPNGVTWGSNGRIG